MCWLCIPGSWIWRSPCIRGPRPMATLAETPSHGRCPKNSNTKPVKLFPPGLLVYTTEKPPSSGGWNALISLIMVPFYTWLHPSSLTPPPSSCLSFCWLHYHTGSQKRGCFFVFFKNWMGSMNSCTIVLLVFPRFDVPLLPVVIVPG